MKKPVRIIRKTLLITGIILISLSLGIYLFAEYSGYLFFDKEKRNHVVQDIKNSPELPERFYQIYNTIYPDALTSTPWGYYYRRFSKINMNECPFRVAAYSANYRGNEMILAAFHLKHFVTSEQTLNYVMNRSFFGHNINGITNACNACFQKNIHELNDKEIIELILIQSNTTYYNRKKYPERMDNAIELFMNKLII